MDATTRESETRVTRLRAFLDSHGVRYKFVAELLGIDPSTMTHYLTGRDPFPPRHAERLAERYGVGVEQFAGWEPEPEEVTA